jgi:hypothetical protein
VGGERYGPAGDSADRLDEAYLELVGDGYFGAMGSEVVLHVVAQTAGAGRSRASYPTLDERWDWLPDDVTEAAQEFMAYLAESGKLAGLLAMSTDGRTLERGLRVRCLSWFQDLAKTTDAGAFHLKLRGALKKGATEGEVQDVVVGDGEAWHRTGDPPDVYRGDDAPLLAAALATDVASLHYRRGNRRDPIADWRGVLEVAVASLAVASMAVLMRVLHRIGLHRFGIDARGPAALDETRSLRPAPNDALDAVLVEQCAADVAGQLDEETWRTLVASADTGIGGVSEATGSKRSAAYKLEAAAVSRLQEVLVELELHSDPDFARVVVERVLELGRLRQLWTEHRGSSSSTDGGVR